MDIVLALQFISQQYINGVFDGEEYHQRFLSTLEEAVSKKDADTQMMKLARLVVQDV